MLHRSPEEIKADWASVYCNHVIGLLESALLEQDGSDAAKGIDPEPLVDGLLWLQHLCESDGLSSTPCKVEVYSDLSLPGCHHEEEDPFTLQDTGRVWIEQRLQVNKSDSSPSFWIDSKGPRRIRVCYEGGESCFEIDRKKDWQRGREAPELILQSLKRWRLQRERESLLQLDSTPATLTHLDFSKLADDLKDLDGRYQDWLKQTNDVDLQDRLKATEMRTRLRLDNGRVDLIDVASAERLWLAELWAEMKWLRRWIEVYETRDSNREPTSALGEFATGLLSRIEAAAEPPGYVRTPESLQFGIWADHALETSRNQMPGGLIDVPSANEATSAVSDTKTTNKKNRKDNSVENVNKRIWEAIQKDYDIAITYSLNDWVDYLKCGKGTAQKTEAWTILKKEKKLRGIGSRRNKASASPRS